MNYCIINNNNCFYEKYDDKQVNNKMICDDCKKTYCDYHMHLCGECLKLYIMKNKENKKKNNIV